MTYQVYRIHKGDVGTLFRFRTVDGDGNVVDISSATEIKFRFEKSGRDPVVFEVTGEFATDGSDGIIQYKTVSGDIDVEGYWRVQAFMSYPDNQYHTSKVAFSVWENLEVTS